MRISAVMYPSIHAKLNGMYAQKLKKQEREELTKQNTIKQVVALLKSLNDDFKELEDDPRRIKIKMLLDDILIKDIKKIYRLLNKNDKQVFRQFISIYEIKCIKSVFRKLSSGNNNKEQTNETQNWVSKIFKNLKGILTVQNYDEFLEFLKETKYYEMFKKYDENINQINIFEVENELDKFYFERMMKTAKQYNHGLEDMIGRQIDLNNVIWIYRVKKNYDFSDENIQNILVNIHYKLKKSDIQKLIQAENAKEMIDILQNTYYAQYINFTDIDELEEQVDKYLYKIYIKRFRDNIFEMSSIYAYVNMIEQENNDIMNIVEGIRYQLPKDEIRKKLL